MHDWFKLHLQAQVQLCVKKKHWQSYSTGDGQGPAKREKKVTCQKTQCFTGEERMSAYRCWEEDTDCCCCFSVVVPMLIANANDEPLTDPWWLFCRQRVQPAFLHEQEWTKLTKVHVARKSWHWPVLLSCHFSPTKFLHPRPSPSRLALLILLGLSCHSAPSFGYFYAPSLHTLHGLKTLHPSSR